MAYQGLLTQRLQYIEVAKTGFNEASNEEATNSVKSRNSLHPGLTVAPLSPSKTVYAGALIDPARYIAPAIEALD